MLYFLILYGVCILYILLGSTKILSAKVFFVILCVCGGVQFMKAFPLRETTSFTATSLLPLSFSSLDASNIFSYSVTHPTCIIMILFYIITTQAVTGGFAASISFHPAALQKFVESLLNSTSSFA